MRYKNGAPFSHHLLDQTLKEQIVSDTDKENRSLMLIKEGALANIDGDKKQVHGDFLHQVTMIG